MTDDVAVGSKPRTREEFMQIPSQDIIKRPSEDIIKRMQEDARNRLHAQLELIEETYDANIPAFKARTAGSGEHWCTGEMVLSSVIVNTGIKINNLEFREYSEVLKFKGSSWGVGVGYGKSFGTGVFYEPPYLLRGMKVNIELAFFFGGVGGIQTSFWDGSTLLGAMNFVGAGGGVGVFWGSGTFSDEK
jgi:hypothetical protein